MAETANVNDLLDSDVLADVSALIDGADSVDGIEIDGCDYDDARGKLFITLVDADGNSRTATFEYGDDYKG